MVTTIEENLRKKVSKERNLEMRKYGRIRTYDKIATFLDGNKKIAFSLVNHALAIIDDEVDTNANITQLDRAKQILNDSFNNRKSSIKLGWEKNIFELGAILLKLKKENFEYTTDFFNEVINYWDIEKQNLKRKDKILNSYDLDKLNSKIGKSVGIQFLYLLCPELDKKTINSIAYSYGFAIKLADNVSDLNEDLNNGFINISKENIKKYNLDLKNLTEEKLNPYIQDELNRIKDYYKKGDEELNLVLVKYPSSRTGVLLFKEIAYSWFKQVLEVYKKIKRLERDSNPRPHG